MLSSDMFSHDIFKFSLGNLIFEVHFYGEKVYTIFFASLP
jgi:hypothetical protein